MTLKLLVTDCSGDLPGIRFEGGEILDVLGEKEEALAVQLQEILDAVTSSVKTAIAQACDLQIELSGEVELKASAGVRYLIFNVGGEASKTTTLKVTLKTRIDPA